MENNRAPRTSVTEIHAAGCYLSSSAVGHPWREGRHTVCRSHIEALFLGTRDASTKYLIEIVFLIACTVPSKVHAPQNQ